MPTIEERMIGEEPSGWSKALDWASYLADSPGALMRGGIGNLVDLVTGEDKQHGWRASSRDLLEQRAGFTPNEDGIDTGDVLGFLGDMALDPLNLVGGGLLAKLMGRASKAKAANRGIDAANALSNEQRAMGFMPEEIAKLTKIVDETGAPKVMHHGTPATFDKFSQDRTGGLINFGDTEDIAKNYAHGAGGYRHGGSDPYFLDPDTGKIFAPVNDGTGKFNYDDYELVGKAPRDKIDSFNPVQHMESVPESERYLLSSREIADADFEGLIPDAQHRKQFIDSRKTLDLKTEDGLKTLASLVADTDRGQSIVDLAKPSSWGDRRFDWSNTKHEPAWRVWQNDLNPKLKELGYDSLRFGDYGHDTLSVMDPSQIYAPGIAAALQELHKIPKNSPLIALLAGNTALARSRQGNRE